MDGFLRYTDTEGDARVGWYDGDRGTLHPLQGVDTMADLLRLPLVELRERADRAAREPGDDAAGTAALPPVDGHTEVWASGVTYERSRQARGEESDDADIYDRVYDAERPELFFKAPAWRVVTGGEPVAYRADSPLNVPEPELALVVNAHGEIVGYCVCDDMSSRSVEGENALYLPQAKVYAGSCALSALVRPVWDLPDAWSGEVTMTVVREGEEVYAGRVALSAMRRDPAVLVDHLLRSQPFPDGAVLATGTGIVPEMSFTLAEGDRIDIAITGVGTLSNPVVEGTRALEWLVAARRDHRARPRMS
ncbi:2-dehydro-3-deoxy-D-arabinonate dehydratase [Nocardiopsis sp. Huas11]|uniref:fumarylacetoacetate hydrolase family protein n=1 Tax=Nocardiopsis sp. Huas11 TaxID=2183912 RepID=UPI000EB14ECD|nr:fumarylacetoacetate hydrolase family protein [Nocardiopsis sp. Huas11]RKS07285.1 2-dehydro-3-deoxy-D-arabinonate dehydratase [Nocardiopsis sp. Huas11]